MSTVRFLLLLKIRLDTPGVMRKVTELFIEHVDLLFAFNTFLPQGFQITQQDVDNFKRERDGQQEQFLENEAEENEKTDEKNETTIQTTTQTTQTTV